MPWPSKNPDDYVEPGREPRSSWRSRYGRGLFVAAMVSVVASNLGGELGVRVVFTALGVMLLVACAVVEVRAHRRAKRGS